MFTHRVTGTLPDMVNWLIDNEHVRLGVLVVGSLENNVYLLACPETDAVAIVDAADEASRISAAIGTLTPTTILTTHGHWDHVGAVDEIRTAFEIPFRMHSADTDIAERTPDIPLTDHEVIRVGHVEVTALHTPGHTPGSVCFSVAGALLTGDTLFPGGPGATRFPYSSFPEIMDSLTERLFPYPDDMPFYPGHGSSSTIGTERPDVTEWRTRGW